MEKRRVVVTGVGVISSLGRNRSEFWDSVRSGRSGIEQIQSVPAAQLRFPMVAEVRGYDPEDYFPGRSAHHMDRFAQFALIAAREAVEDSRIDLKSIDRTRAGAGKSDAAG